MAQYSNPHRQVSNTHSNSTLTVSRDRAKPASRPMNPACMKKTKKAVTSTQTVLIGLTRSLAAIAGVLVWAPAAVSKNQKKPLMAPRTATRPIILPPRMVKMSRRVSFSCRSLLSFALIMPVTVETPCCSFVSTLLLLCYSSLCDLYVA